MCHPFRVFGRGKVAEGQVAEEVERVGIGLAGLGGDGVEISDLTKTAG
jgi:hypothetical protein